MADDEIAAIAAATKALFDQRDLTMRAEMATMRATVEAMEAELREVRAQVKALPCETHAAAARMVATLGTSLADALPDAVSRAADRIFERRMAPTRAAELERAMPTGAAS